MKPNNKYEIPNGFEQDLRKALEVYYRVGYGNVPQTQEFEHAIGERMCQMRSFGEADANLGISQFALVKFRAGLLDQSLYERFKHRICSALSISHKLREYEFWLFDNASGTVGDLERVTKETCGKIELAWLDVGLPVKQIYSGGDVK